MQKAGLGLVVSINLLVGGFGGSLWGVQVMGRWVVVWMMMVVVCAQVLAIAATTDANDFAVLNALKSSWQNLPPDWTGSDPCGSGWEGVRCQNSQVTFLVLAGMGVIGTDIGDIPSLSQLQYLDLSNNKGLRSTLPSSIGNLQNLTTLILIGCNFFGPIPDSIGSLPKLAFLALNNNSFTGFIPASIGNLSALSWLDLSDNNLNGSIPVTDGPTPGLDMLLNAGHFHLAKNQLSGPVPPQLFSSKMRLIHVILDNNHLIGGIPASLGLVESLEVVRLDWNSFNGSVPPIFGGLQNVTELNLSNNNFTGPLPNLTGTDNLSYLDISNNSFDTSDVPTWIAGLQSLTTLMMDNTQLQGEIPSNLFQLPSLETMSLSNNRLNGTLNIGTSYSSNLTLDLQNNSITDFAQSQGYNLNLTLVDNPICVGSGATEKYCIVEKPSPSYSTPSNNCNPIPCNSDKVLSPNCICSYPYTGTIHFYSFSFSNLENATYYKSLQGILLSVFLSNQLPVDSISLSDASIDVYSYLQFRIAIFPSGQSSFNRTAVAMISSLLNRQQYQLPQFGPLFFLDDSYCCFSGEKKSANTGIIVGAVIGGFVLVLLIVCTGLYAFYLKRKAEKASKQSNPFASWIVDESNGSVPQLKGARWCSFEELSICTSGFSEDDVIGVGGYGKVYKGTLSTGQVVAIKRAKQGSMQGANEFRTEIELLSRIHHKNVVSLVGFCYEQGEQMLVYEYISNGTLKDNLSGKLGMRLDWRKRLKIALDSARGLAYLHELADPPIIHRDIKSTNILLDDHLNAKVADFGLSKLFGDTDKGYVSTQVKGTLGYMDPEYFMSQQLTDKSDVYSFGVVLLELLTGRSPIQQGRYIVRDVSESLGRSNNINDLDILDPNLGPAKKLGGLAKFIDLAMSCVKDSGAERPKTGEVVRKIENILQLASTSFDKDSGSAFTTNNVAKDGDLYHSYSDSTSDQSSMLVPFHIDLR